MKKLIAQRPIQYMGRTYERGEAIPAQDPKMVAAWLKANSAAWTGTDVEDAARAAIREAARRSRVNDQAAEAIRAMGVTIEDPAGQSFDPARHSAVMHVDSEELGEGVVSQVFQKGFLLGEKVIRFAAVQVAN